MNHSRIAALVALPLLTMGALTACSAQSTGSESPTTAAGPAAAADGSLLAANGLDGLSGRQIIETLDQRDAERPLGVGASVRYDQVLMSDGTTDEVVELDGDEFYLSVAPYETFTHDCYFHNLGTCQGELAKTDVHVTITTDDGDVLVDEDVTTYSNGFAGFWIPKDVTGTVVVTKDGKTAQSPFSSDPEGPTCLTTLKLV